CASTGGYDRFAYW
nr:immunoglobulin heavy chain junction region [Mus musculus]